MIHEIVDLYQYFSFRREGAPGGRLTVWAQRTPEPVSRNRKRPAILILPGGGYNHVSPREGESVALRFTARGYAAFVLEYSCAPSGFPTPLLEAAMAMRFLRENAARFEINPHMAAAMGFSAGGHLCGLLGTLYDSPELSRIGPPELLRPDALGLCYPVAVAWGRTHAESFENLSRGDPALRQQLSLDALVRPDMPPVFLWHTRDDGAVPVRNSLVLAAALEEAGVDFALHVYRHGQHGLSTADEMAYPAGAVPEISWDVPGWPEALIRFFGEIGFQIQDFEVET